MRRYLIAFLLCVLPLAAMSGNPFLLTMLPRSAGAGPQTGYLPVNVDESVAMRAATPGLGMWVSLPDGSVYIKYRDSLVHPDGTWTWVGTVSGVPHASSALITFGDHAVFGTIPVSSGTRWSITTSGGRTWLVPPDASPRSLIPKRSIAPVADRAMQAAEAQVQPASDAPESNEAAADRPATVDLLVLYTPGFRNLYGSDAVSLARINHEVDLLNQAYKDSKVYGRIRLVHASEVAYPDVTDDADALSDLRHGVAPLDAVSSMRAKYGADEVVLMRAFVPGSSSCGTTYSMGYNLAPITASDAERAFVVLNDDSDEMCFLLPGYGLATMLGDNYGLKQDPQDVPGPYPFSYAYQIATPDGPYPTKGTLGAIGYPGYAWPYFSNPDINLCNGGPCGVPDQSDAARSLNLTLPTIAAFEPTRVPVSEFPVQDVDGNGKSDLLWMNTGSSAFGYWRMNGPNVAGLWSTAVASGYRVAATGDFNGDGRADVIWTSAANDLYLWSSNGSGFDARYIGTYPAGEVIVGAGDIGGDGKSDLLWMNAKTGTFGYWAMDGATIVRKWSSQVAPGYSIAAVGDFNGDGRDDVVWTSAKRDLYLWESNGSDFDAYYAGTYPAGWTVAGAGDINADGLADLLWRNQRENLFGYWIMDGPRQVSGQALAASGQYSVAAIEDFNGDGKVDVMWTSAADDLYLWTSNGNGFDARYVGTYPKGWTVIPGK